MIILVVWLGLSAVVAAHDDVDDRPWWARAVYALLIGGIISFPFALAELVLRK